jgi:3-oxoacyl-[acyl-carrier protein] reductase
VVILITGGASGLGESITRKLAADPANTVHFTYHRSAEAAEEITSAFPNTKAWQVDFGDAAGIAQFISSIPGMDPDVLVNNALTGYVQNHFHKLEPAVFVSSFATNVMPAVQITQAVIRLFRKKKSGRIITILTSYLVNTPPIGLSEYVANKAYLLSLSKSWAVENAAFKITSNCVSPSIMLTGLTGDMDDRLKELAVQSHPLRQLLPTEEVAGSVHFLVHASSHINGINLIINAAENVI